MATYIVPLKLYITTDSEDGAFNATVDMMESLLDSHNLSMYSIYVDGIKEGQEPSPEDDNDD
jgi:hypothetical protein